MYVARVLKKYTAVDVVGLNLSMGRKFAVYDKLLKIIHVLRLIKSIHLVQIIHILGL